MISLAFARARVKGELVKAGMAGGGLKVDSAPEKNAAARRFSVCHEVASVASSVADGAGRRAWRALGDAVWECRGKRRV